MLLNRSLLGRSQRRNPLFLDRNRLLQIRKLDSPLETRQDVQVLQTIEEVIEAPRSVDSPVESERVGLVAQGQIIPSSRQEVLHELPGADPVEVEVLQFVLL